jgi:hypothetical protein
MHNTQVAKLNFLLKTNKFTIDLRRSPFSFDHLIIEIRNE